MIEAAPAPRADRVRASRKCDADAFYFMWFERFGHMTRSA
jgi:hypothetical protein